MCVWDEVWKLWVAEGDKMIDWVQLCHSHWSVEESELQHQVNILSEVKEECELQGNRG